MRSQTTSAASDSGSGVVNDPFAMRLSLGTALPSTWTTGWVLKSGQAFSCPRYFMWTGSGKMQLAISCGLGLGITLAFLTGSAVVAMERTSHSHLPSVSFPTGVSECGWTQGRGHEGIVWAEKGGASGRGRWYTCLLWRTITRTGSGGHFERACRLRAKSCNFIEFLLIIIVGKFYQLFITTYNNIFIYLPRNYYLLLSIKFLFIIASA